MFGLIMRDFRVQRKRLLIAAVYCVVQTVLFRIMGEFALVPTVLMAVYFVLVSAFEYDDKYGMDVTFVSLPIAREKLVLSRYLEIPIVAAGAVAYYMLITMIIRPFLSGMYPTGWLLPALSFLIASLIGGLYMPIVYRFGYMRARVFFVVILLFGILLPCYLLANTTLSGNIFDLIAGYVNIPEDILVALMFAAAVIILVISCYVSIRCYRKRQF